MPILGNTLTNASGGFAPTGAYSLEFFPRIKETGELGVGKSAEFFFLLGLTKVDKTFSYLISTKPTYGGASVTDYGNGLVNIAISGEIYAHYTGKPVRKPTSVVRSQLTAAADIGSAVGDLALGMLDEVNPVKKSGYLDFFDLIWLLHTSRSIQGFKSIVSDSEASVVGLYETAATIKSKIGSAIKSVNFKDLGIIFHDYDSNFHYEVSFDPAGLTVSQSADDPLTWNFSMRLIGIADYSKPIPFRRPPLPNVRTMLNNALFLVNGIFQDVTQVTLYLADAATALSNITDLCETLKSDLKAFQATNKALIKKIRVTTKQIKDKNKELRNYIVQYLNNQSMPSETDYTASNANYVPQATDPTVHDLDVLTTAVTQIEAALILNDNETKNTSTNTGISYITVPQGATLESLAQEIYGSVDQVGELILLNGASIVTQDLTGQIIKIPSSSSTYQTPTNTGVITAQPSLEGLTPEQIQTQLELITFGQDLAVDPTGDFIVSQGDLAVVQGINSLAQNLLDLLATDSSPIPLQPDFETGFIPGEVPDEYLGTIGFQKIINKVSSQQGVASVRILRNRLEGNSIFMDIAIQPIGNFEEFVIKFRKSLVR